MNRRVTMACGAILSLVAAYIPQQASAAQGEMGTGIPNFGYYAATATAPSGYVTMLAIVTAGTYER